MTSPRQRVANRLNAQRSTGPKSEAGLRRASVNATKHGLTSGLDASPWGDVIAPVSQLLQGEGYSAFEAGEVARRIAEFERNVAYQRERFADYRTHKSASLVVPQEVREDLALIEELLEMVGPEESYLPGIDSKLALEMADFLTKASERQVRVATRDAEKELKNADRYLRRAANQLIRHLKYLI